MESLTSIATCKDRREGKQLLLVLVLGLLVFNEKNSQRTVSVVVL